MNFIRKVSATIWARFFEASSWAGLAVLADVLSQNIGQHTAASDTAIGAAVISALIAFLRAEGVSGSVIQDLGVLRQALPLLVGLIRAVRAAPVVEDHGIPAATITIPLPAGIVPTPASPPKDHT